MKTPIYGAYREKHLQGAQYSWQKSVLRHGRGRCTTVRQEALSGGRFGDRLQNMSSFMRDVPGGVFVYSAEEDEEFSFVSENMLHMLGYTLTEFKAKFHNKFSEMIYWEDRAATLESIWQQIAQGSFDTCFYRIEKKDGSLMWVHDEGHIITDERGKRWFYVVIVDHTAVEKDKDYLSLQNEDLRRLVNSIPARIVIYKRTGEDFCVAAVSGYLIAASGVDAEKLAKMTVEELLQMVAPEDRETVRELFHRISNGESPSGESVVRIRTTEDADYRWFHCSLLGVKQADQTMLIYTVYVDVTAEKHAEALHREMRMMYESAVESAKLVVWEYDILRHRVIMADNEFSRYDYSRFNLPHIIENVPEGLLPYIDEGSRQDFLDMYRAIDEGAPRVDCEVWYKLRDGRPLRCEAISYTTVFDASGRPVKAYGIGQNITMQKIERENYDRLYEHAAAALSNALCSFKLNLSKNQYISGYSLRSDVLRYCESQSANEHFARVARLITDESIRQELLTRFNCEQLIRTFQSGCNNPSLEYPVRFGGGKTKWMHTTTYLIQNPVTGDVEALTSVVDITSQRLNEEIMKNVASTDYEYFALIDVSERSIRFFDVRVNCEKDYTAENEDYDEKLRCFFTAAHGTEAALEHIPQLSFERIMDELRKTDVYVYSFVLSDTEGRPLRKQLKYSWLNASHEVILLTRADISEAYRQELEQYRQMEEALRMANEANRAKTEFVSRISHDIRTPLGIISNMTEFALADLKNEAALIDDLNKIRTSNAFLLSLINDVLDISKVDSGSIELHPEPYFCEEHIANITNLLRPMCEQKGLHCVITCRRRIQRGIFVDKVRLNQIILNLLSNSVKYTPSGGTVSYISDSEELPGGQMRFGFEIRDTGIGMSEEFQKHMFEPFTQEYENPGREKNVSGTGLGLYIVKRDMEMMGGTLEVSSISGQGTVIRCSMHCPGVLPEQEIPALKSQPAAAPEEGPLHGCILLAEDNAINAEIAERILSMMGLSVVHAENGQAAVELFSRSAPGEIAVVLMDIQMPVLNGYEATAAIRALARPDAADIPIIALTADAFDTAVERSRSAGMNDYLTKPLEPDVIRQVLGKYI